jgi:ParB-like chromosome segregation protein Spo0J
MKKKVAVPLSAIKQTFVVRLQLNHAHVDYLKGLVEVGVELPPLRLSDDDNELIDGRHRLAAYQLLNQTETSCVLEKYDSQADKIIAALKANVGGSLPPTEADVSHVMQILLSVGESRKSIIEKISEQVGFPPRLVRQHLDYVQSNQAKARLKKAVSAVVNQGKTVPEAAAEFAIKIETLQANLKKKTGGEQGAVNISQLKSHLSQNFNRLNSVFGHNLSRLTRDLTDGVSKPEEVADVLAHVNKLVRRLNLRHEEWLKRLGVHASSTTAAMEVSRVKARIPKEKAGKRTLALMGLSLS